MEAQDESRYDRYHHSHHMYHIHQTAERRGHHILFRSCVFIGTSHHFRVQKDYSRLYPVTEKIFFKFF